MKTITFYSYKGGVGRSLALSNIAIKLSQLKKKVFVIDFDLEAPGLQFKFENNYTVQRNETKKGLVDYIYSFSNENTVPESLTGYLDHLLPKNTNDNVIHFLSAGDFENNDYWRKLATMRWSQLFYANHAYGIRFFLDLKARIEKEFSPDYLLIDSRTGITDISGITLKIFADEIVVLAIDNKENLFGTKKIIASLTTPGNELLPRQPGIHFVLTRLPFPQEPEEKANEHKVLKSWEKELSAVSGLHQMVFSIIHADKQIQNNEIVDITSPEHTNTITYDYLKLFEKLIDLRNTPAFEAVKQAEIHYNKALIEKDSLRQLEHLTEAIRLDPSRHEYFIRRGTLYRKTGNTAPAVHDFLEALKLNPENFISLFELGYYHFQQGEYARALDYLDKISHPFEWVYLLKGRIFYYSGNTTDALEILTKGLEYYPENADLYNIRANIHRRQNHYQQALKDIYKAIELAPEEGILFSTLAEIQLDSGEKEDFYLNLHVALSKGVNAKQLNSSKEVYEKVSNEPRFLELLAKYQLSLEEVLL